jgi:hypothetical protein
VTDEVVDVMDIALAKTLPMDEDDRPVRLRFRGTARDNHGLSPFLIGFNKADELSLSEGVQSAHRFVEDDDLGIMGDGLGELEPLAHAAAVRPDQAVLVGAELDDVERLFRPGPCFFRQNLAV